MMNMQKIKKLTTQSELKLIQAARARKIEDSKKLKSLVKRTRILRNKYQDLAKKQSRKNARGVGAPQNTLDKVELFKETLSLLQKKKSTDPKVKSKVKTLKNKKPIKPSSFKKKLSSSNSSNAFLDESNLEHALEFSDKTRPARKSLRITKGPSQKIRAHQGSRTRRRQKSHDIKNAQGN